MSLPAQIGSVMMDMNPLNERPFPFQWWAMTTRFTYQTDLAHLYMRLGSAAEAFLLRAALASSPAWTPIDRIGARLGDLELRPQHTAAKSRIDFAVLAPRRRLAIEVDGREFHHKTETQVQSDYLRERRLTAAGYSVVRFTAVETYRNAEECWRQVRAIVDRSPEGF